VDGRYLEEVYCDGNVRRRLLHSRLCVLIASCSADTPHEPRGSEYLRDVIYIQTRASSIAVTLFSTVLCINTRSQARTRTRWSRPRYGGYVDGVIGPNSRSFINKPNLSERSDERTRGYASALAARLGHELIFFNPKTRANTSLAPASPRVCCSGRMRRRGAGRTSPSLARSLPWPTGRRTGQPVAALANRSPHGAVIPPSPCEYVQSARTGSTRKLTEVSS
jgi:hypothetical protein